MVRPANSGPNEKPTVARLPLTFRHVTTPVRVNASSSVPPALSPKGPLWAEIVKLRIAVPPPVTESWNVGCAAACSGIARQASARTPTIKDLMDHTMLGACMGSDMIREAGDGR